MTVEELKKHWSKGVATWEQAMDDKSFKMETRLMAKHKRDQLLLCIMELELLNGKKNARREEGEIKP